MAVVRLFPLSLVIAVLSGALVGCTTTSVGNSAAEQARASAIAAEPPGNYYIGRRYVTERTRFWGYLRKPGQPWSEAKLVVMNEALKRVPDRLPESPIPGNQWFTYDHNFEYRVTGRFSGESVYDPNSNAFLPEFLPTNFELISESPGWLFQPGEGYDSKQLPPKMN
ncbi:MAG: hypothetical protein AAGJ79_14330 [Verrucomicrobiota bacterium]